jgi:hypothetical protein
MVVGCVRRDFCNLYDTETLLLAVSGGGRGRRMLAVWGRRMLVVWEKVDASFMKEADAGCVGGRWMLLVWE